jgi:hypothetical protein
MIKSTNFLSILFLSLISGGIMRVHENIEKMFYEDVREKKKTGNGAFHKAGKGVRHGFNNALRTPSYFMKTKEKKSLNGEVERFNMNEIMTKEEFNSKDFETKKMLMTRWRELYPNGEIIEGMGLKSTGSFHNILKELAIPKKTRWDRSNTTSKKEAKVTVKKEKMESPEAKSLVIEKPGPELKTKLITRGLNLEYNGDYTAEEINKILTKLQLLVDGEENKFSLSISLSERA